MKLAIISNHDGVITASAVCQAFFDGDMSRPVEVKLAGRSLNQGTANGSRFHIVDAPPFIKALKAEELHSGLERLHTSMSLDVVDDKPTLRARECYVADTQGLYSYK